MHFLLKMNNKKDYTKIAHIINPVVVEKSSDLFYAQPITIKSMIEARMFSHNEVDVKLFAAVYPEDEILVNKDFDKIIFLSKSVLDLKEFNIKRKLPLIKDILEGLYNNSDAEYFIYTNSDIGLQPYFYNYIKELIDLGYDGLCINRKTIPKSVDRIGMLKVENLSLIYTLDGNKHHGIDCFIFKRSILKKFNLGDMCIGFPPIGTALKENIEKYSTSFYWEKNANATFHLGSDRSWKKPKIFSDYLNHNKQEWQKIDSNIGMTSLIDKLRFEIGFLGKIKILLKNL